MFFIPRKLGTSKALFASFQWRERLRRGREGKGREGREGRK